MVNTARGYGLYYVLYVSSVRLFQSGLKLMSPAKVGWHLRQSAGSDSIGSTSTVSRLCSEAKVGLRCERLVPARYGHDYWY
jgi:hypothetical protein